MEILAVFGDRVVDYFQDGREKALRINYVLEKEALGAGGALALVSGFIHDYVLLMNSDLLTNIYFENLYLFFEEQEEDFVIACISYQVNVPHALMEAQDKEVTGFKEKPSYTHYSNAGIYLMKRKVVEASTQKSSI